MSQVVSVKISKLNGEKLDHPINIAAEYLIGESVEEAVALHGENVVLNLFKSAAIAQIQAVLKKVVENGGSEEEAIEAVSNYKLHMKHRRGVDPTKLLAKVKATLPNMTPEQQAKFDELTDLFE